MATQSSQSITKESVDSGGDPEPNVYEQMRRSGARRGNLSLNQDQTKMFNHEITTQKQVESGNFGKFLLKMDGIELHQLILKQNQNVNQLKRELFEDFNTNKSPSRQQEIQNEIDFIYLDQNIQLLDEAALREIEVQSPRKKNELGQRISLNKEAINYKDIMKLSNSSPKVKGARTEYFRRKVCLNIYKIMQIVKQIKGQKLVT